MDVTAEQLSAPFLNILEVSLRVETHVSLIFLLFPTTFDIFLSIWVS